MDKPSAKKSAKTALRESILARKSALKPIAFSLDEVRAIAKTNAAKVADAAAKPVKGVVKAPTKTQLALEKPVKPSHVKAASLADILGFNPKKNRAVELAHEDDVPEKFRRYYKILVEMRSQLTEGIERHSEESLKRSAKDDSGDLSAYGQSMSDGGINTFDRDFVLEPRLERAGSPFRDRRRHQSWRIPRRYLRHLRNHGQAHRQGAPPAVVPFARNSAEAQEGTRAQPLPLPGPRRGLWRNGRGRRQDGRGRFRGRRMSHWAGRALAYRWLLPSGRPRIRRSTRPPRPGSPPPISPLGPPRTAREPFR